MRFGKYTLLEENEFFNDKERFFKKIYTLHKIYITYCTIQMSEIKDNKGENPSDTVRNVFKSLSQDNFFYFNYQGTNRRGSTVVKKGIVKEYPKFVNFLIGTLKVKFKLKRSFCCRFK